MKGHIFKKHGSYYIRYELPPGPDGKRRQRCEVCRGMNSHQAEQKLRDVLSALYNNTYVQTNDITLSAYLDDWLERMQVHLSPTTWESYSKFIEKHIKPGIGHTALCKLTPYAIQVFYDTLSKSGRLDGKKGGLSAKSIHNIHGILHSALNQALRLQMIPNNPADSVMTPRVYRPDIRTARVEDIDKILSILDDSKYKLPVIIILATGMRRGEALALRWCDFNAEKKTLTVRRSLAQIKGSVIEKEPKSGRSRVVLIPDTLYNLLNTYKTEQDTRREVLGEEYNADAWICAEADGRPLTPQGFSREFYRKFHDTDIDTTLHGLRHTQATALIMAGVPVKVVSERLGHATVSFTQDIYAHVLPHMQQQAADVTEGFFSGARCTDGARTEPDES